MHLALLLLASSCARATATSDVPGSPPPSFMLGEFRDDYGERHSITQTQWFQRPDNRFRVVRWVPEHHYLIAQNDFANRGAPGRWTRIDWVRLDGIPPYAWAFCFSAYDAPSAAAAESVSVARPDTPKTGCNGHPYTRMQEIMPTSPSTDPAPTEAPSPGVRLKTDIVVIGAGQAGLSTAYHLGRRGLAPIRGFVVLDQSHRGRRCVAIPMAEPHAQHRQPDPRSAGHAFRRRGRACGGDGADGIAWPHVRATLASHPQNCYIS